MRLLIIILLIISIVGNIYLFYQLQGKVKAETEFAALEKKYPLLSKRILHEYPQDLLINFLPLRAALTEGTQPYGDTFGLYFEYLPTGTSININGSTDFSAASLFKLPVVMAYYHMKERTKNDQDKTITIREQDLDDRFGDLWQKGAGTKITLEEAVELALIDSDNTAAKAIIPYITQGDFDDVYEGLDIELKITDQGAIMTAKHYSSILKALYFSSVLNKDNSQEILDYLIRTKYNDKIPGSLPDNVPVAHKIGVFQDDKNEAYMDCGIVYIPRRPYLLCMISKSNEDVARNRMQTVSATVYDYVVNHK